MYYSAFYDNFESCSRSNRLACFQVFVSVRMEIFPIPYYDCGQNKIVEWIDFCVELVFLVCTCIICTEIEYCPISLTFATGGCCLLSCLRHNVSDVSGAYSFLHYSPILEHLMVKRTPTHKMVGRASQV